MDISFSEIGVSGYGFTNQIFFLITNIILMKRTGANVIVVGPFLDDFAKNNFTPISKIIDIDKLNVFLEQTYGLILVDKSSVRFDIVNVTYGMNNCDKDLTAAIKNKYFKHGRLFIPKGTNMNAIAGDPIPGHEKALLIRYSINNYERTKIYHESIMSDIVMNPLGDARTATYTRSNAIMIGDHDPAMFHKIFAEIEYTNEFVENSRRILTRLDPTKRINVVHLRIEDDCINHWSGRNNCPADVFRRYIEHKYMMLIRQNIEKEDETIILSETNTNRVVQNLIQEGYNLKFSDKFYKGREKNAIVDLLISKLCNNVCILAVGSTFSHYIRVRLSEGINVVEINLDNIGETEVRSIS